MLDMGEGCEELVEADGGSSLSWLAALAMDELEYGFELGGCWPWHSGALGK